ncbi:MAG: porin family protein [Pseudomonadota bacterium]
MEIRKILVMTLLMLAGVSSAYAEFERAAGVSLGSASWSFDDDQGYETRSTAYKLFTEAAIDQDWKLGVGIVYLGEIEHEFIAESVSADGLTLFGVRHWAFSESVSLRGTVGISRMNTRLKSVFGSGRLSDTDLLLGLGAEAQLSEKTALRLEYELYRMALDKYDFRAGVFFLGLVYNFY